MLLPIIIILLLVAFGVSAFVFMGKKGNATSDKPTTESVSQAPTEEPTPTEEAVDLKEYKIMVINGTEVAGEASKLKTSLNDAGYNVTAIGNADKTTYTKTIIQAKSDVKEGFINKLKEELSAKYEVGSSETLEASDDNNVEVKIIIGIPADKQKEASDSASTKENGNSNDKVTPTKAESTETPTPTKSQ